VPLHLRNAPTKLMKDLEYGKGYKYAHHEAAAIADVSCLPSALEGRKYYEPKERGFQKEIKRRLTDGKGSRRSGDPAVHLLRMPPV
jgi:putative ATPase